MSKQGLRYLYEKDYVLQFKGNIFALGHSITNYSRWFASDAIYEVKWGNKYEPYVIMHWDVMPWFNIDFKSVFGAARMHFLWHIVKPLQHIVGVLV